jgi:mannose-6-phosphate isomerase
VNSPYMRSRDGQSPLLLVPMRRGVDFGPIIFEPIFFERIWGGQKLSFLYGKQIPCDRSIGESWELVDRAEAQSIVKSGPLARKSLHDLWVNLRSEIFGEVPDAPRFPLLIKLLDCEETLSLQVHPPREVATVLGGEGKTECWYIADASPQAELYLGLREQTSPAGFRDALNNGSITNLVHRLPVKTGDAFLIPSGTIHAIGAGNLIVEVQQNSDTTFRVYDWGRKDRDGKQRELHIEEATRCIDFGHQQSEALVANGETLVDHELFKLERWQLEAAREFSPPGRFAIGFCLSGSINCGAMSVQSGEFFLWPASIELRTIEPAQHHTSLLRITIPEKTGKEGRGRSRP